MKSIAEEWGGLTKEEKQLYEDMHTEDLERMEFQLHQLKENGYFIMPDGSKSSDHTAKPRKVIRRKGKAKWTLGQL